MLEHVYQLSEGLDSRSVLTSAYDSAVGSHQTLVVAAISFRVPVELYQLQTLAVSQNAPEKRANMPELVADEHGNLVLRDPRSWTDGSAFEVQLEVSAKPVVDGVPARIAPSGFAFDRLMAWLFLQQPNDLTRGRRTDSSAHWRL